MLHIVNRFVTRLLWDVVVDLLFDCTGIVNKGFVARGEYTRQDQLDEFTRQDQLDDSTFSVGARLS